LDQLNDGRPFLTLFVMNSKSTPGNRKITEQRLLGDFVSQSNAAAVLFAIALVCEISQDKRPTVGL
jgi:hypothetical protein